MAESEAGRSGTSPIEQALGDEFRNLHAAVRRHYAEPTIVAYGIMDSIDVKSAIKPLALVSHSLFNAPVPYSGRLVEISLYNRIDSSGTMHWVRRLFANPSFPRTVTFVSHMACSGDHRLIETTRYGLGIEADLSVTDDGSLVYHTRNYVVRLPFLGLVQRFPTWLSPFGSALTREIGESEDSFRIEFEMVHPVLGRTIAYSGSCRFGSPGKLLSCEGSTSPP